MTNTGRKLTANIGLQAYALLFLVLGGGLGAVLGYSVGAASDGSVSNLTLIPEEVGARKSFNWLFFEIGIAAGLIACAVLIAASFRYVSDTND
ncbi:MAG: hypothetical protein K8R99_15395 [Actinomycetia bacterium]|nr:hypothetical protein [Actinomycetes bacterium]